MQKKDKKGRQGSLLTWNPFLFFLYTAQPYNEMKRSEIELLHGWTQPFSRSLLLLCSRILTYDRLSHLHPVHRS